MATDAVDGRLVPGEHRLNLNRRADALCPIGPEVAAIDDGDLQKPDSSGGKRADGPLVLPPVAE
eukprot:5095764-Lingulodinium_polyedra.AAC.1